MLDEIKYINHLVQFICTISCYYNVFMIHEKIIRKEKRKASREQKDPFSFTQGKVTLVYHSIFKMNK